MKAITTPSQALQRVVVRMLFDPALVRSVYQDAGAALSDVALDAEMLTWLTKPDPRAWTVDRQRRARTLAALIAEYPVTTLLNGPRDGFMSSAEFHSAVQRGEPLALAYGDYLRRALASTDAVWPLPLECAMASLRRSDLAPTPVEDGYMLAPGRACVRAAEGAMEVYASLQARARVLSQEGAVEGAGADSLERWRPRQAAGTAFVLVERDEAGQMALSGASAALGELLEFAATGASRTELLRVTARFGCDATEGQELLDDLTDEGLLIPLRLA